METFERRVESATEEPRTTQIIRLPSKAQSKHFTKAPSKGFTKEVTTTQAALIEELSIPSHELLGLKNYRGPCNCSKLIMTSNNPTTISKHGSELGQYVLVGGLHGRPVYKHVHRSFFLFYQPESGGNWLVNTQPGLMFGGIQNSKVNTGTYERQPMSQLFTVFRTIPSAPTWCLQCGSMETVRWEDGCMTSPSQ